MKQRIARLLPITAIGFALCSTSAMAGFAIQGGKLVEGNGSPFVMRGVSHPHAWYKDRTPQALKDIAATGANSVRIVLSAGKNSGVGARIGGSEVAQIIQWCKDNKLIAILEIHDSTGYGDNSGADNPINSPDYWLSADIRNAINGQEDYVIINVANEPLGNGKAAEWAQMQNAVVKRLRDNGIKHTLMLDAPNWGQDWSNTMRGAAKGVFDNDKDKNIVFSVHMYGNYGNNSAVRDYLDSFKNQGLPLVVGEFAQKHWDNGVFKPVDFRSIFSETETREMGYLAWSWSGNGGNDAPLDITNGFNANSLTSDWGVFVVADLKKNKDKFKVASIFGGTPTQSSSAASSSSNMGNNIAAGKTVTASSTEGAGYEADKALDSNMNTRWASSLTASTASLTVDLGGQFTISGLKLSWEAAYAKGYDIQVSSDGVNYSNAIFSKANGTGGTETITVSGQGRYVRINMTAKGTNWGYSLWDVAVYGVGSAASSSKVSSSAASTDSSKPASSTSSGAVPGTLSCTTTVVNSWADGYQLDVKVTNTGNPVNGWTVYLNYPQTAQVTSSWNVVLSGNNTTKVTASNASYNGSLATGGSTSFGVTGTKSSAFTAPTCSAGETNPGPVSSSSSSSSSVVTSSAVSSAVSSAISSASSTGTVKNIALGKTVSATSVSGGYGAANVVDGKGNTRWSSSYNDVNSITVDLGGVFPVTGVKLSWEAAFASAYQIQVSTDNITWSSAFSTTAGDGGVDDISFRSAVNARYVRMNGIKRATKWGYSLWEFEVYTGGTSSSVSSTSSVNSSQSSATSVSSVSSRSSISSVSSVSSVSSANSSTGGPSGTSGTFRVDASGNITKNGTIFPVRCGNWFGLEGQFEPKNAQTNPGGAPMELLVGNVWWKDTGRTIQQTMNEVKAKGLNMVRLPIAPQTLDPTDKQGIGSVRSGGVLKNAPSVLQTNARQAMEDFIKLAAQNGIQVLIDIHSCSNYVGWRKGVLDAKPPYVDATRPGYDFTREDYSCSETGNPSSVKVVHAYNEAKWLANLKDVAGLSKKLGVDNIIGIDIFNEPWGYSWEEWKSLSEKAYQAINSVNPDILVFVEGVSGQTITGNKVAHGEEAYNPNWGENLFGQGINPLDIPKDRLVLSPHTYGPSVFVQKHFLDHSQAGCAEAEGEEAASKKCRIALNPVELAKGWDEHFGKFRAQGFAIVAGEFGGNMDWPKKTSQAEQQMWSHITTNVDEQWQNMFVDYMKSRNIQACYWAINPESGDTLGWYTTPFDPITNAGDWGTWGGLDPRKTSMLTRLWGL